MIFISYRRSDGKATAQLIMKSLIQRGFDKKDIFLDLHDINAEDFTERCHAAIHGCDAFLLLITKDSFVERDGKDYYYEEIRQALKENKKIVPVLYDTVYAEQLIPLEFKKKKLHLKNAITYNIEYDQASMDKIEAALTKKSIGFNIAKWFKIPLVFITIYVCISVIGGFIRYAWDNYWLSDATCQQIASRHIEWDGDTCYYYCTHDSIYCYNISTKSISIAENNDGNKDALINIRIQREDLKDVGFWAMVVGVVHEITKTRIKPHGNGKYVGIIVAGTLSVIAGFGSGFAIERMIYPVYESRLIRRQLHNPNWWEQIIKQRKFYYPHVQREF